MKNSTPLFKRVAGLALALLSAAMVAALLNYSLARFSPAVFAFEDDLRCGEPVRGNISSPNETDTYSFTAANGQRVRITVVETSPSGVNFQPEWRLLRNNGSPAPAPCGSPTVNSQRDCGPLAASDSPYRIEIRDQGGNATGAYRVQFYRLNAPVCNDRPLACGTRSDASIDDPLDSDLFSFNAVANEPVTVTVVKAASANFQTEWRLLKGNGDPVSGACGSFRPIEQPSACGPLPVGDNPYRVQVQDQGNDARGDYSVTVSFRATACPPTAISLTPSPRDIVAWTSANLTATINPARNVATNIRLASGTPGVALAPNEVTIPANATSASFPVRGVSVGGPARIVATLPAELGGGSATAIINVIAPTLSLSQCSPSITPGTRCTITATLSHALDSNTTLALSSSNTSIATVPNTATIPAGQRIVSFQVTGVTPGSAMIRATLPAPLGGGSATANVTVGPPPFTISLSPILLNIIAGTSENLRVTINQARNQPTQISLSSSHPAIASVPDAVTIPANATSASFQVTGLSVGGLVTITARLPQTLGGGSDTSAVRVFGPTISLSGCSQLLAPGASCTMTVTLSHILDIDVVVALSSSNSSIADVPLRVTIPDGQLRASFQVTGVRAGGPVTIVAALDARLGGDRATANVTVGPFTGTADIDIIPSNPTTENNISIRISGTWPNACTPQNPQVSRVGAEIRIATSNPAQFCAQVLTNWSHTVNIGQLAAGTYLVLVTYTSPNVSQEIGRRSFNVATAPTISRIVRVVNTNAGSNSNVDVPITLDSQGNENAIGFSLSFNTAILSLRNPPVVRGNDADDALVTPNDNQAGRLGVLLALPAGQRFSAGVREIAKVRFSVSATSATSTTITPVDQPIVCQASDASAGSLPVSCVSGVVTISQGLEGDTAPRPNGNGSVTIADCVQAGLFVAGRDTPSTGAGGEFQRADVAPRETRGDGRLAITDWVQACRYAAALDPTQPAGGPANPVTTVTIGSARSRAPDAGAEARTLRVVNAAIDRDGGHWLSVTLDAQGNENALGFSLRFDPTAWQLVSAMAGGDAGEAMININDRWAALGRVGIALALSSGQTLARGARELALVKLAPISREAADAPAVAFGDLPVAREAADANANALPMRYLVNTSELRAVTVVSAASFNESSLAAESIATAFGVELANATQAGAAFPLPTELAGTRVTVRDSAGVDHPARLFFVSPTQINFQIPEGTPAGIAAIIIARRDGLAAIGATQIAAVAPALFTANSSGDGVAAALALRVRADGSQQYEPVALFDPAQNRFVAVPIARGEESDQLFLSLFGTGWRHRSSMAEVKAKIGGVDAEVIYAGAQGGFAGLDQINLRIPRSLIGRGEVEIVLTVAGQKSNPARVSIGN